MDMVQAIGTLEEFPSGSMRVLLWNLNWALPGTAAGRLVRDLVLQYDPDIACFPEAVQPFFDFGGFVVTSAADYGYRHDGTRRKVVLWSKLPWHSVDEVGDPALPSGRFVRAETSSPAGPIHVFGVCVPWADAHVSTGQRNRRSGRTMKPTLMA